MTVFAKILEQALAAVPGARGAAFADWEGETVDGFSTIIGHTNLRLIGAHWGIIYQLAKTAWEKSDVGTIEELVLEFSSQRAIIRRVTDEYFVVMALAGESNLAAARRSLATAVARLREEM